jgi:hypothetical protein
MPFVSAEALAKEEGSRSDGEANSNLGSTTLRVSASFKPKAILVEPCFSRDNPVRVAQRWRSQFEPRFDYPARERIL